MGIAFYTVLALSSFNDWIAYFFDVSVPLSGLARPASRCAGRRVRPAPSSGRCVRWTAGAGRPSSVAGSGSLRVQVSRTSFSLQAAHRSADLVVATGRHQGPVLIGGVSE
jgi:hypothetical protein